MKMKKLLRCAVLFSICALMSMGTFAQRSKRTPIRNDRNNMLIRWQANNKARVRFHQPLQNRSWQQKPTKTQSRLKSFAFAEHDGVQFVPSDSVQLYWGGTNNMESVALYLVSQILYYPDNSLYTPLMYLGLLPNADSSRSYEWDDGPGIYELSTKSLFTLDAEGNVISQTDMDYDGTSWENSYKHTFTYDAQSNRISELEQDWNGSVWENRYGSIYTYDANNNLTGETYIDWNNSTSSWDSTDKYIYTYDAQNNLTTEIGQEWDGGSGSWENDYRYSYIYTNGNRVSEVEEEWDSGTSQWENDYKIEYTYDANDQRTIDLEWQWNSGAWEENYKTTYTYDGSGNNTSMVEQSWDGSSWEYEWKEAYAYSGTMINEVIGSEWVDSLGKLVNSARIAYTFNSYDQCTSAELNEWNGTQFEPGEYDIRFTFHYEEYDDGTEGINKVLTHEDFQIYPNPSYDQLNIKMDHKKISHIRITDLSGKVVFESRSDFNASEVAVPVRNLANGIYLLQLQSGDQKGARTFVVQH